MPNHWQRLLWPEHYGELANFTQLALWPIDRPANRVTWVNQADNGVELKSLRQSVQRGRRFGRPEWQKQIAARLGLGSAYRSSGRPRKVGWSRNGSHMVIIQPNSVTARMLTIRKAGNQEEPVLAFSCIPGFLRWSPAHSAEGLPQM